MTDYATLLKESGLKATFQRMNILERIEAYGHISIDSIYEEVIKAHPSLSLATVYKNIILMVEKGVLVEVPITGKKSKYELLKEDHIHLVCTECGEVEDKAKDAVADDLFTSMTQKENFTLSKQQVNLYGVCNDCNVEEAS
ncbi:MAG: transcriptional repressor [Sulfurovum sp.]|nr:transcriptional repressor [Sulfurovum sp.]NNJ45276.1 transcriptional repressor [Sulfurovum sp.]